MIIFGSIWFLSKKIIKPVFKKNETEPEPVQTDWFWFGSVILEQKPVQTGLALFFGLARFFSGLGSVQFFRFQAYKTKTEPVGFLKILIDFFSQFGFLVIFSCFLNLISFLVFFLTSTTKLRVKENAHTSTLQYHSWKNQYGVRLELHVRTVNLVNLLKNLKLK